MKKQINNEPELPPKPIVEYGEDIETATSKTMQIMTDEQKIKMLSSIRENDVARIATLLTIGGDIEADIDFIKTYAYTELALSNSVMFKQGGIRSEQILKMIKQPELLVGNENGIINNIRSKFRR